MLGLRDGLSEVEGLGDELGLTEGLAAPEVGALRVEAGVPIFRFAPLPRGFLRYSPSISRSSATHAWPSSIPSISILVSLACARNSSIVTFCNEDHNGNQKR